MSKKTINDISDKDIARIAALSENINAMNRNYNLALEEDILPTIDFPNSDIFDQRKLIAESTGIIKNIIHNTKEISGMVIGSDAIKYIITNMKGTALYYYIKEFIRITVTIMDVRKPSIMGYNNILLKRIATIQSRQDLILKRLGEDMEFIGKERARRIAENIQNPSKSDDPKEKLYRDFLSTAAKEERKLRLVLDKFNNYKILHIDKYNFENLLYVVKEYLKYYLKYTSYIIISSVGGINITGASLYSALAYIANIAGPGTLIHSMIASMLGFINTIIAYMSSNSLFILVQTIAPLFSLMLVIFVIYKLQHAFRIRIEARPDIEEIQKRAELKNNAIRDVDKTVNKLNKNLKDTLNSLAKDQEEVLRNINNSKQFMKSTRTP